MCQPIAHSKRRRLRRFNGSRCTNTLASVDGRCVVMCAAVTISGRAGVEMVDSELVLVVGYST